MNAAAWMRAPLPFPELVPEPPTDSPLRARSRVSSAWSSAAWRSSTVALQRGRIERREHLAGSDGVADRDRGRRDGAAHGKRDRSLVRRFDGRDGVERLRDGPRRHRRGPVVGTGCAADRREDGSAGDDDNGDDHAREHPMAAPPSAGAAR